MKMKKIAAILTALSVFSGCAGNNVSEESAATTVTVAETSTTSVATEVTTTEMTTVNNTSTTKESKEKSSGKTKAPWGDLPPRDDKPLDTTTVFEEKIIPHIELVTLIQETKYTEFESVAMLLKTEFETSTFAGSTISIYFGNIESDNPEEGRINGWGCYPKALVKVLNADCENSLIDLSNSEIEVIYSYIDLGKPVAVWVTENLAEPEISMTTSSGHTLYKPNECVTLVGYSETEVVVYSLLQKKYVTYDRALFEQRYAEMGSMALTVVKE